MTIDVRVGLFINTCKSSYKRSKYFCIPWIGTFAMFTFQIQSPCNYFSFTHQTLLEKGIISMLLGVEVVVTYDGCIVRCVFFPRQFFFRLDTIKRYFLYFHILVLRKFTENCIFFAGMRIPNYDFTNMWRLGNHSFRVIRLIFHDIELFLAIST
jgi:hypothetical protein